MSPTPNQQALLLHYAKHLIKDVCLTSTVDLFACYNEMQAARSQCAGMYSHAIEAAENLSEALELEHDILEAAKLGELADASFKDLLKRLKRIKILYCHGVPTVSDDCVYIKNVCSTAQPKLSLLRRVLGYQILIIRHACAAKMYASVH